MLGIALANRRSQGGKKTICCSRDASTGILSPVLLEGISIL